MLTALDGWNPIFILNGGLLSNDQLRKVTDTSVHHWRNQRYKARRHLFNVVASLVVVAILLAILFAHSMTHSSRDMVAGIALAALLYAIEQSVQAYCQRRQMRQLKRINDLELPSNVDVIDQYDLYFSRILNYSDKNLSWDMVSKSIAGKSDLGCDLESLLRRELHATAQLRRQMPYRLPEEESRAFYELLEARTKQFFEQLNNVYELYKAFDKVETAQTTLEAQLSQEHSQTHIRSSLTAAVADLPPLVVVCR